MTGIDDKLGRGAALVMAAKALSMAFAAGAAKRDSERVLAVGEMAELRSAGLQAARVPVAYGVRRTRSRFSGTCRIDDMARCW